jgi:hypothetical protein
LLETPRWKKKKEGEWGMLRYAEHSDCILILLSQHFAGLADMMHPHLTDRSVLPAGPRTSGPRMSSTMKGKLFESYCTILL